MTKNKLTGFFLFSPICFNELHIFNLSVTFSISQV